MSEPRADLPSTADLKCPNGTICFLVQLEKLLQVWPIFVCFGNVSWDVTRPQPPNQF